jgi:hypothetical protein
VYGLVKINVILHNTFSLEDVFFHTGTLLLHFQKQESPKWANGGSNLPSLAKVRITRLTVAQE